MHVSPKLQSQTADPEAGRNERGRTSSKKRSRPCRPSSSGHHPHTLSKYTYSCVCLSACLCLAYKVPITYHTTDWQPVHVLRRLAPSSRSDPLPALCPLLSFSLFFLIFFFFSHFPCTQFYPFHLDLPPSRRRILIPNAAAIYLRCPRVRDQLA